MSTALDIATPELPSAEPTEIKAAVEAIDEIAGKTPKARKYSGQGMRGTYAENKAVERRGVDLAIEYFKSLNKEIQYKYA